jgi:hypothetical protein
MAEREQKWTAFASDPEWLAAKAQTEANGPIVNVVENMFLQPTPYSSVR